ncbi:MAG TPA: MogA/MoaB family molybdenum cofactor biosynthesis protein [Nitrospirales bacterium]|nr:MogA/MoaB family molybdenum cofactor biosynthesis protein [Nitrospirales bacterium]HIO21686.1 MogA/MoaB family molybdenum cofactor biosynthesis protein [Nitrospirales bacterium]
MGHTHHKAQSPSQVGCGIITCSDSRTQENDRSGQLIMQLLTAQGHTVERYEIVKDEPSQIRNAIDQDLACSSIQAILINGGTGVSKRDSTYETVSALLDKRLDGFGELFRFLSYQDIGSSAIMSRATAGVSGGTVIFALPGSEKAVRLAMEKLILPELGHLIGELGR